MNRQLQQQRTVKMSTPPSSSSTSLTAAPVVPSSLSALKYCVVLGCKNTGSELLRWKATPCPLHNGQMRSKCGCRNPFSLFPFPNNDKLRKLWLYRVGLPGLKVSNITCICSIHFVEGKPTSRSFFPTLYLQMEDEDELVDGEEEDDTNEEEMCPEEDHNTEEPFYEHEEQMILPCSVEVTEIEEDEQEEDSASGKHFSNSKPGMRIPVTSSSSTNNNSSQPFVPPKSDDTGGNSNKMTKAGSESDVQVLYQAKPAPLAKYDPNAQTLQISNPVQYIVQCHNRIAELVAENDRLKSAYDIDVKKLQNENRMLRQRMLRLTSEHSQADTSPMGGGGRPRYTPIINTSVKWKSKGSVVPRPFFKPEDKITVLRSPHILNGRITKK